MTEPHLLEALLNDAVIEIERLNAEITRLRASPWVSGCEWQWHKLAERMVTACGNESDSVGAFCQFCGGKVEVV